MNRSRLFQALSGLIALLLIIGFAANNQSVRLSFDATGSWREFVASVHAGMPKGCANKNRWIDLNGLLMRLMGRRLSNETLKYRGGILEKEQHPKVGVVGFASKLAQWDSLLRSWGGRYMLVLAPDKLDRALEMLPPGVDPQKHNRYESFDELQRLLSQKGIPMIDLSFGLADDLESVKRNFYCTDHHWRYEAAFSKFPEVARKIAALAGLDLPEDLPQFDINNWQAITFENDFLGSYGRRTGVGFAGKDDFTYFIPKFETDIDFYYLPKRPIHRHGSFRDSIIDPTKTVSCLDPYEASRYHVYIGGGHWPISIKSKMAPCKMRLMVIKDSYALPMLGYLSTVFSHIEVIDPRGYTDSIVEFVKDFRPDVMVTLVHGKALSRTFFVFDPAVQAGSVVDSVRLGTISKLESTSNNSFVKAKCRLNPGTCYRLRMGMVELSGAGDLYAADVCLYDVASKKQIAVHAFRSGLFSAAWSFAVPTDAQKPQLLFYAGRQGACLGKSAVYRDVVLEELKGGK